MPNEKLIEEVKAAIGAHVAWKMRLKTAISTGRSDAHPDEVARSNLCAFASGWKAQAFQQR